jgi:predicted component of type VI protein secretion system
MWASSYLHDLLVVLFMKYCLRGTQQSISYIQQFINTLFTVSFEISEFIKAKIKINI